MIQLVGRLDETARRKLGRKPIAHLQILPRPSALVRVQCDEAGKTKENTGMADWSTEAVMKMSTV